MSFSSRNPNALIHSTSPYLLQHAYNPVNWQEWSAPALAQAVQEDKPILVSIGYSSCHWCHVMEHQSFEDVDIAAIMNEHFICIKVDREERPDVDNIYMDAVQAMGINGGWPLNVFLTPDQKPFYGGTYFPPTAWAQVLNNIHKVYQQKRSDILQTAEQLTKHLASSSIAQFKQKSDKDFTTQIDSMYKSLASKFDRELGGLDRAPKFIMPSIWLWMLRYHHLTNSKEALEHTLFSLRKIAMGGIYDQLAGGFSRYSVDAKWFVPHFEKMLYDNAQLLSLYSEAYTISKEGLFKDIIDKTIQWLQEEMLNSEGGFYSALDADSEGIEGKYYCWTKSEIDLLLRNDSTFFCDYYAVTESGNWENGVNILKRDQPDEFFRTKYSFTQEQLVTKLSHCHAILKVERTKRVRPGLDDKIITGWNAMLISGLLDAYHAVGDHQYKTLADNALQFILKKLKTDRTLFRSFKGKQSKTEGFLEDYAFTIRALLDLYQTNFNETLLQDAVSLMEGCFENFFDQEEGYFHFASAKAEKLIATKKELFDNVIPSSNSVMASNLLRLSTITENDEWKEIASNMINAISSLIVGEPNYMSNWGIALMELQRDFNEVVFIGEECIEKKNEFRKKFQPFSLFMGTPSKSSLPLLRDKTATQNQTTIYVCYQRTCKLPTSNLQEALTQLQ